MVKHLEIFLGEIPWGERNCGMNLWKNYEKKSSEKSQNNFLEESPTEIFKRISKEFWRNPQNEFYEESVAELLVRSSTTFFKCKAIPKVWLNYSFHLNFCFETTILQQF